MLDAHGAAGVRIGARRIEQQAVDAERLRRPGDRAEVLVVVQALEYGEAPCAVHEFVDAGERTSMRTRQHAAMQIEADHLGDHVAADLVHRDAAVRERRCVGGESFDPRGGKQDRSDLVTRLDQPGDRHVALDDEQIVTLVAPTKRLVVQCPIVVEPRIVGTFDDDRAQRANTCESSANALNSSALPDGSSRNIVDCSPT